MALNPPAIQNRSTHSRDASNPIIQSVLLLVVLVLFSWFILKPKLSHSREVRNNLQTATAQLAKIQQDQQDLNRLVDKLRSSSDEVVKVDEALPLSGRATKVYVMLDSFVRSSGMTLTLISADDTNSTVSAGDKALLENPYQSGRQLHTISLATTITGTMEQFKNFLELVETSSRVLDVEDVKVLGGEPLTKFQITVKAYSYEQIAKKVE